MTTPQPQAVCVIGIWHLGIVNAVGFAETGYQVIGVEFEAAKVDQLQRGVPPLFEPGLEPLLKKHLASGQLKFSADPTSAAAADYVVIAYDSPVNDKDQVDITPVVEAAKAVAAHLQPTTPLVITSQLPLGSSEDIEAEVRSINPVWQSGVVYTPENLRLGSAIDRFAAPDMIVLGASSDQALNAAQQLYQPFDAPKPTMSLRSAEMVKHALNTFLATAITFGNEMANIADRLGADAMAVASALKLDQRIGKAPIFPGLGFSGGTLARDVTQLKAFSDQLDYPAALIAAIQTINEDSFDQIVVKLQAELGSLQGKTIGIMGLTYKPSTSTMRRSPAIKLIQKLAQQQVTCVGYDPIASATEFAPYADIVTRATSALKLAKQSDALVLVTEWPEFLEVDYVELAAAMSTPIFIDTKNFLDPAVLSAAGFRWQGYGRKA